MWKNIGCSSSTQRLPQCNPGVFPRTDSLTVPHDMTQKYLPFAVLVLGGLVFRLVLVVYGEYHDKHSPLKYTDIDYRVFSDAASFILHPTELNYAQGHLGMKLDLGE